MERLTQIKLYNRLLECYLVKKQRIEAEMERDSKISPNKGPSTAMRESLEQVNAAINELV